MIRRDYILDMIEKFMQAVARMAAFKREKQWQEFGAELNTYFSSLFGFDPSQAVRLSESVILASILNNGPFQAVQDKLLMMASLLKEAGDAALEQGNPSEAFSFRRKALRLLVANPVDESNLPAYVPKVEGLLQSIESNRLELEDLALVMRYYESLRNYCRAEDILFEMMASQPANPKLLQFGEAFYLRLSALSDAGLVEAGFTREEVQHGHDELLRLAAK